MSLAGRAGLVVALFALFAAPTPAGAQDAVVPPAPSQAARPTQADGEESPAPDLLAGPIDPARYRLGPGDMLSLEWTGRASRQVNIVVDAEGRANVPEIGVVPVAGRSLADVRGQVLGRLRPIFPGARVDLRLVRVRGFKVYVSGQVRMPGVVAATAATRASELFRGPFTLRDDASRRNIELRRHDGTRLRVDLDGFAILGRDDENPYLEDGDVLLVPARRERVYALGSFARPGEYEFAPGDSISDLVELAGGLLPGTEADAGRLVRFVTATALDSLGVDLAAVLEGRGDLPLQHQDRLFARAPSDYRKVRNVSLFGEVRLPGPYAIHGGEERLGTLLARAGGLTTDAASRRIQVFRRGPFTDQRDIEFERLSRLARSEMTEAEYTVFKTKLAAQQAAFIVSAEELDRGGAAFDVRLEDGDVVVVDRETQAVRIAGEVRRPALVEFVPGRSAEQYIALAGGYTGRARRGEARVSRTGSNQTLRVDDVREIQAGDFIWVPEKKDVNFWGVVKDVLLVAGSVATVIILVRDSTR